jgi:glycosyltransferase involved in cell wall biosynthesis
LEEADAVFIIDGYNPVLAEWLASTGQQTPEALRDQWQHRLASQAAPLRTGDFFICASERQRDWWLGLLEASGRVNPATYQADPTLRGLVDVVPYGLPEDVPVATRKMIKGVWPGIVPADKVVLWGGGLWPWLDPLTAIQAIGQLATRRAEIKLIFPGTRHPNPDVTAMPTLLDEAKALAAHLHLLNRTVFFGDWVAYTDWPNVLLESDVALTLHKESVETRLAFRSRVLDYVWAGLPTVATQGDATSDLIAAFGLGIQVRANDAAQVADAIVRLVDEPRDEAAFAHARTQLNWEAAAAPLIAFCRSPHRAADRQGWPSAAEQAEREIERLKAEVATWQELVMRYEQGRFMRTMRAAAHFRRKLWGAP